MPSIQKRNKRVEKKKGKRRKNRKRIPREKGSFLNTYIPISDCTFICVEYDYTPTQERKE